MQPLQKLFNKLNGLHYQQEYLCLAKESFENPIHAYLVRDGQVIKDITNEHLFTGYSPLIFTLISSALKEPFSNIEMFFSQRSLQPNDFFKKRDAKKSAIVRFIIMKASGVSINFFPSFTSILSGWATRFTIKKRRTYFSIMIFTSRFRSLIQFPALSR